MRISEIQFNQVTHKSDVSRYDFDDYIGNTEPTGKVIGGYEIHEPVNYPYKAFLIKSKDDEGFLGALQLTKFNGMWKSEVMFAPEIQGKGFAIPLYRYVIKELGLTVISDRSQSPGGAMIWEKLAEQPDINVYIYDTGDKKLHGEYDPRDSGRVYGPEDWRHKIRLVATTDTVTSVQESWSEKYKKSINCSNPKGFSQRAHCAGRKKKTNEGYVGINELDENFADGKKKGKSRPGRVKKAGASCQGSVSHLRAMAKKYGGERGRMYHWCANMKGGKKKKK